MITDDGLQTIVGGDLRTGSDIGGTAPVKYGIDQSNPPFARFFTQGGPFSDWLWAVHRAILPNTGKLKLSFDLTIDSSVLICGQAIEFDTILAFGGFKYNMSSQINIAAGSIFQISDVYGNWATTGIVSPALVPGIPTRFLYEYGFNFTTKRYGIIAVTIAGQKRPVPAVMQNLLAQPSTWADSCSLQVQLDLNSKGGSMSHVMTNAKYIWG